MAFTCDTKHKLSVALAAVLDVAMTGGMPKERAEAIYQDIVDHWNAAERQAETTPALLLANLQKICNLTAAEIRDQQEETPE